MSEAATVKRTRKTTTRTRTRAGTSVRPAASRSAESRQGMSLMFFLGVLTFLLAATGGALYAGMSAGGVLDIDKIIAEAPAVSPETAQNAEGDSGESAEPTRNVVPRAAMRLAADQSASEAPTPPPTVAGTSTASSTATSTDESIDNAEATDGEETSEESTDTETSDTSTDETGDVVEEGGEAGDAPDATTESTATAEPVTEEVLIETQ